MKSIKDICYSQKSNQYLDVYLPENNSFPVFLYFHGGGLERGDKAVRTSFIDTLTNYGIAVVSANYRMYPDAKYPDFLYDAAEATAWVFNNMKQYGEVTGIFVGGSSAGGYLSQMLCFDKRWLVPYGISPADIAGFVHDAGQPTCHFKVLKECGIDSRRVIVDDSAPLYHVGEDETYPPMLILVSDDDMRNRLEQTMLLVSTLNHFGHTDNVILKIIEGKHCCALKTADENGDNILGKLVYSFIAKKEI